MFESLKKRFRLNRLERYFGNFFSKNSFGTLHQVEEFEFISSDLGREYRFQVRVSKGNYLKSYYAYFKSDKSFYLIVDYDFFHSSIHAYAFNITGNFKKISENAVFNWNKGSSALSSDLKNKFLCQVRINNLKHLFFYPFELPEIGTIRLLPFIGLGNIVKLTLEPKEIKRKKDEIVYRITTSIGSYVLHYLPYSEDKKQGKLTLILYHDGDKKLEEICFETDCNFTFLLPKYFYEKIAYSNNSHLFMSKKIQLNTSSKKLDIYFSKKSSIPSQKIDMNKKDPFPYYLSSIQIENFKKVLGFKIVSR